MKLMRQLDDEHRKLWLNLPTPSEQNIQEDDCDPTLLAGWTDADLSLWSVDQGEKITLQDILVALCRNKKEWKKICYLTFHSDLVKTAGLNIVKSNGKTGIPRVDSSGTHFELKGVTGKGICALLSHLSRDKSRFEIGTFTKKDLDEILFSSYDNCIIQASPLTATSREGLPGFSTATSPSADVRLPSANSEDNPVPEVLPLTSTAPSSGRPTS
ncbi:hypothetical protein MTYP_03254 [Methylophilaceae bacterium]|nr:hypothetical protein MTYP_03254 [Methylophilaceae bacterium]